MKESIANAYILMITIVFITLIMLFFSASLAYTKAFKVKNRIVNIIEANGGYNDDAIDEIEQSLADLGYRINKGEGCTARFPDSTVLTQPGNTDYRYCVQETVGQKGKYYGVTAYMYFEIPLIGKTLEFPVYGETPVMGLLG